MFTVMLFQTVC